VGDVFRSENIPGLVFEEDTVVATDETVDGPRGPVSGAVRVREHLMDNTSEEKTYGPGYGEMRTAAPDEQLRLAIAAPIDTVVGPVPGSLQDLEAASAAAFAAARAANWPAATAAAAGMANAWDRYRAGGVPPLLATEMSDALGAFGPAVAAKDGRRAGQAAVDAAGAAMDLRLRHGPVVPIDIGRMDVWVRQVLVDVGAGVRDAVVGDVATLEAVRGRVVGGLDPAGAAGLDTGVRDLRAAAGKADVGGVVDAAVRLRAVLAGLAVKG
jgi:hypothetical protein